MSQEAGVETVPVSTEEKERMVSHIVCGACYPTDPTPMGTPGLCGEGVLGIPAGWNSRRCKKCEAARGKHYLFHVQGRGQ